MHLVTSLLSQLFLTVGSTSSNGEPFLQSLHAYTRIDRLNTLKYDCSQKKIVLMFTYICYQVATITLCFEETTIPLAINNLQN